jgi:hypothetical protein
MSGALGWHSDHAKLFVAVIESFNWMRGPGDGCESAGQWIQCQKVEQREETVILRSSRERPPSWRCLSTYIVYTISNSCFTSNPIKSHGLIGFQEKSKATIVDDLIVWNSLWHMNFNLDVSWMEVARASRNRPTNSYILIVWIYFHNKKIPESPHMVIRCIQSKPSTIKDLLEILRGTEKLRLHPIID